MLLLEKNEKIDKRRFKIETSYIDNGEVISEGHAYVSIIPTKILDRTLERLLLKKN